MSDTVGDAPVPKVVAGIRRVREELKENNPAFVAAVEAGRETNAFVESVRADLAMHRKSAGLDQADVGHKLDLSQSAISKIENGHGDLSLKMLYRFAEAVGQRPVVLMIPSATAVGSMITSASPDGTGLYPSQREAVIEVPKSARAIEEAQIKLLRRMSDVMPEVLADLVES